MGSKLLAVVPALALIVLGCGGGGATGADAKNAKSATRGATENDVQADAEPEVDPRKAACADGTCFECGSGLCPKGFFCDEKAPGGAACAWLPECAASPSCACVKSALEGCACEERSGGVFASCK